MSNCSDGWSNKTEFSDVTNCTVYLPADYGLKTATAILAGLVLLFEVCVLLIRRDTIKLKTTLNIILIAWTMIQNVVMILQNGISAGFNVRSKDTLWMALFTHIAAASAAAIVILFVYIEIRIRTQSFMKTSKSLFLRYKKSILLSIAIIQTLLFVIGPLVSHFSTIKLHIMFWAPVVIIDFTLIPYFCFLTFLLYRKIAQMIHNDYRSLSHHLLVTGILCGGIGAFTGVIGLLSLFNNNYEWVLIRAAWSSDIIFNLIFFIVLVRRPIKTVNSNTTPKVGVSKVSSSGKGSSNSKISSSVDSL